MPRKNMMSQQEVEICQRLRKFRESTGLTQTEFARRSGLTWPAYSSYEHSRATLNYPAAYQILTRFVALDPKWLAQGGNSSPFYGALPKPGENGDGPRTPFSEVYSASIHPLVMHSRAAYIVPGKPFPMFRVDGSVESRARSVKLFSMMLAGYLQQLTESEVGPFLDELADAAAKSFKGKKLATPEEAKRTGGLMAIVDSLGASIAPEHDTAGKNPLLTVTASDKCLPVTLAQLLKRLKALTAPFGKVTELAEFLGATLPSVSVWLNGKRQPGGDVTLRMLEWVEAEEAKQQKSPGSADTPPEQQTQIRRSDEEKPNPNPLGKYKRRRGPTRAKKTG